LGTKDEDSSGTPIPATILENMDTIHSMVLDNRRIFAKKIGETLAISREGEGYNS
jgi:hypothetical protein